MVQMQESRSDGSLRQIIEEEQREAEAKAAAYKEWEQAVNDFAVATISSTITAAMVLTAHKKGHDLFEWTRPVEEGLAQAMRARDAMMAEADIQLVKRPNNPTVRTTYALKLEPLEEEVALWQARLKACRVLARERVEAVLNDLITVQVKARDAELTKVVPFEDRIREFEEMKQVFGVSCMSSRVLGVARLLAHE